MSIRKLRVMGSWAMLSSSKPTASELKRSIRISDIIGQSVALKKRGHEFIGLCPFHNDSNPSFTVNDVKGFYKCFSCGAYGDVFDYMSKTTGMSMAQARDFLGGGELTHTQMLERRIITYKKDPWKQFSPAISKPKSLSHPAHGVPSRFWVYRTLEGKVIGYVCRWDLPKGKQILPYTQCENTETGEIQWRWKSFAKPRPLYGLEKLQDTNPSIYICEGEKSADAAQILYPNSIALSWPGGSNAVKYVDWRPLKGRTIILWADNDYAGTMAMNNIEMVLEELKCKIYRMILPPYKPNGWDAWDMLEELNAETIRR